MLTTNLPKKSTPEYGDEVVGNADTGASSKKTRAYTLDAIFKKLQFSDDTSDGSGLITDDKSVVGSINEIYDLLDDEVTVAEIANRVFKSEAEEVDVDAITQQEVEAIFDD